VGSRDRQKQLFIYGQENLLKTVEIKTKFYYLFISLSLCMRHKNKIYKITETKWNRSVSLEGLSLYLTPLFSHYFHFLSLLLVEL